MNKFILIGGAVVLGVGALLFFQSSQEQEQSEMMPPSPEATASQGEHVVVYSNEGYSPKEVTIKKGDRVIFRNESTRETWPASAMHPSHAAYPGSSIGKCGKDEENQIFDACRGLKPSEEWSFVFEEQGEWFYHDHLRPDMFGKIMVQE